MLKKLCLIGLCGLAIPAGAGNCWGVEIVGKDNITHYCLSKQTMNWWSAFAWCDAQGMRLFNPDTECYGHGAALPTGSDCPQLNGASTSGWIWTSKSRSASTAYTVNKGSGGISSGAKTEIWQAALCQ